MEKVECSVCGEKISRPGMVGHMRWKHGKEWNAPLLESPHKPYINTLEARVASLEQELKNRNEGANPMDDALMTQKDMTIHELKTEMADMEAELAVLRKRSGEYPSVNDFVHHCTDGSCRTHQAELQNYLNGYLSRKLEHLTEVDYQKLGERLGFYRLPDKITIGPELVQRLKKGR